MDVPLITPPGPENFMLVIVAEDTDHEHITRRRIMREHLSDGGRAPERARRLARDYGFTYVVRRRESDREAWYVVAPLLDRLYADCEVVYTAPAQASYVEPGTIIEWPR